MDAAADAGRGADSVPGDLFGLGWRPELAASILANRERLDVVEVMADAHPGGARTLSALETLSAQIPVVLHGVSMGLASAAPLDPARAAKMARLFKATRPRYWSEHLAFVRGGGIEIGHLAAPPRTWATIEGTARNVERARAAVGRRPLLENVATLLDPPCSTMSEPEWITNTLDACGCDLLLDLHNLHANAVNFGDDAVGLLARLPLDRVAAIHLAGGRMMDGGRRLLDDHLHDVPAAVYDLLTAVGSMVPRPLTVILERDGRYPPFEHLLDELDRARVALAAGRAHRRARAAADPVNRHDAPGAAFPPGEPAAKRQRDAVALEAFLAGLYVDADARARFLAAPEAAARAAGVNDHDSRALVAIDRAALNVAAHSFAHKRNARSHSETTGTRAPPADLSTEH